MRVKRNRHLRRIVPYDLNRDLSKQIISITNNAGCVLYLSGRSDDFLSQADVITVMSLHEILTVCSFSISYHIMVINTLEFLGVSRYGCGLMHDNMPMNGVGKCL